MNYKQRMLRELLELKERIVKLDCYNKSTQTEQELILMEKQKKAMEEYANTLEERMLIALEDGNNSVDSNEKKTTKSPYFQYHSEVYL